jgi:hypothetical protein
LKALAEVVEMPTSPEIESLFEGLVVPMPTLPVEEMKIEEVACDNPASLPTKKYPFVRAFPRREESPPILVRKVEDATDAIVFTPVA